MSRSGRVRQQRIRLGESTDTLGILERSLRQSGGSAQACRRAQADGDGDEGDNEADEGDDEADEGDDEAD